MTIRWLRTATRDRFAQLDYIATDNPAAAVRMDEAIERQTNMLMQYPLMGREGRVNGTRELVIRRSPFIAVYRVQAEKIEILRLLHGAQQWPNHMERSTSESDVSGEPAWNVWGRALWLDLALAANTSPLKIITP